MPPHHHFHPFGCRTAALRLTPIIRGGRSTGRGQNLVRLGVVAHRLPYRREALRRGKGRSLNSASLTPRPLTSSVYVHVPEAPSPLSLPLFPFPLLPSSHLRKASGNRATWSPKAAIPARPPPEWLPLRVLRDRSERTSVFRNRPMQRRQISAITEIIEILIRTGDSSRSKLEVLIRGLANACLGAGRWGASELGPR